MSSKKKLITAITSLAVVAVIAVVAVTVTLAALNATVTSGFTISYTAYNVNATITAQYSDATHTSLTDIKVKDQDAETDLTFNSEEVNGVSKAFEDLSLTFSAAEQDIYLVYKITNTASETGVADLPVSFTMTYTGGESNLTIQYHQFTADPTTEASGENGYEGFQSYADVTKGQPVTLTAIPHTSSNTNWIVFKFHMEDNTDPVTLTGGSLAFTLGTPVES